MITKINLLLISISAAILAVSFAFFLFSLSNLKRQEVQNKARFECAQSSSYQVTLENDAIVSYPVADLYAKCLGEKGLQ